jgi:hypothetical protein
MCTIGIWGCLGASFPLSLLCGAAGLGGKMSVAFLYSWVLPKNLQDDLENMISNGYFPAPSIMMRGVAVGVAFCVLRVIMNELVLR